MSSGIKIFGGPGTGKTEKIIRLMEDELNNVKLDEIGYIVFGREASAEALKRIMYKTERPKDQLTYFKTFHSMCSRLLNLSKDNLVDNWTHKVDFCRRQGIHYRPVEVDEDPETGILFNKSGPKEDRALGNYLFDVYEWLQNTSSKTEEFFMYGVPDSLADRVSYRLVKNFCDEWQKYKTERLLYDYPDCLNKVIEKEHTLPVEVLFVDEFQDVSPLLYKVFSIWKKDVGKFYIGGDDDQSIFSWAGATSDYLLDEPVSQIINLPTSYRLHSSVLNWAMKIVEPISKRHVKDIKCLKDEGEIKMIDTMDAFQNIYESWRPNSEVIQERNIYGLFRTRFLLSKFARDLNAMVIPYNIVNGSSPWTDKFLGTYRAFYAIKNRMPVDREDLDALFEVVPSRGILRYGTKTNVSNMKSQNVPFGEVASMFEMTFDINDLARFINFKHESQKLVQRDLFMSLNIRNMKPIKREDVTLDLGTIHSIKGGQRGLVFLSNSINGKIENQIIEDPELADEERRLFYVGATRSSGDLVIMDKFFGKRTFELPEF